MAEKYISLDLNDPRAGKIGEIIGNASCKKILDLLAEKEMNESDIASELKMPLNTAEYNIKKLIDAGLIEESRNYLWSAKGKKIKSYRVVNKKIVITPSSRIMRGIVPAGIAAVLGALGIKLWADSNTLNVVKDSVVNNAESLASGVSEGAVGSGVAGSLDKAMAIMPPHGGEIVNTCSGFASETWAWFLLGALIVTLIFLIWNWRSEK